MCAGIDFDLVSDLEEERDLDHQAGGKSGRLLTTGGSISSFSWRSIDHLQDDRGLYLDVDRFPVELLKDHLISFDEIEARISDHLIIERNLVIGIRVHEIISLSVLVEKLCIRIGDIREIDLVDLPECPLHGGAIEEVLQSGLLHSFAHRDFQVLRFQYFVWYTVYQ